MWTIVHKNGKTAHIPIYHPLRQQNFHPFNDKTKQGIPYSNKQKWFILNLA